MIIKIKREDGVSIMRCAGEDYVETCIEKYKEIHGDYVSHEEIDESDIPTDRTFRGAWGYDLSVDMPKARVIHMGKIRLARDERLNELDKRKYGAEKDDERQVLRDIPTAFDLSTATTPDELKALWPTGLNAPA